MNISVREDELFARWQRKYSSFVTDGVPCPRMYERSAIRTVIVLKDVNAPELQHGFDLRKQLANAPHSWWSTVAAWCDGISQIEREVSWSELAASFDEHRLRRSLEPYAFMQLKKSTGGGVVDINTLYEHARQDAAEIREQLMIYRPHVIIGAGVGPILAEILGSLKPAYTRRGVAYSNLSLSDDQTTYLIHYVHPSARAPKNVICYGLLDAYREVLQTNSFVPNNTMHATCEDARA